MAEDGAGSFASLRHGQIDNAGAPSSLATPNTKQETCLSTGHNL
jgi:hypothetical protein